MIFYQKNKKIIIPTKVVVSHNFCAEGINPQYARLLRRFCQIMPCMATFGTKVAAKSHPKSCGTSYTPTFVKQKLGGPQQSKAFFNYTFDKGRLKSLVSWTLENYGHYKTVELLDQLKKIGFEYATKAGISLGIDDLKIPPKKQNLLLSAEKLTKLTQYQYERADITAVERFQRLIETWHRISEQLKQEVINHFEETDVLNPVYMMAFSGARGNISQVRQLVGMRGLMSNPQGQIIDFPIRSNFREGLTLTEYIISSYGARKGIVDTALRTANAGYLTRRLVDVAQHVIISHFDCGTQKGIFLTDIKDNNKTVVSVQNRIVGRVLARDIYKPNTDGFYQKNTQNSSKVGVGSAYWGRIPPGHNEYIKVFPRNQEISSDIAFEITKFTNKIFVRSPLTCNTRKLLCQLCYGWSLAQGNLVSVGEAVGVIAAQSIGEPGTQLTMRTFHTGGVFAGDVSDEIRAPYNGFVYYDNSIPGILMRAIDGKILFLTKSDGTLFFSKSNFWDGILPNGKICEATSHTGQKLGTTTFVQHSGSNTHNHAEHKSLLKTNQPNLSDIKKFKIPAYTILFMRNGEEVFPKQVVAQITSIRKKSKMHNTEELVIKSDFEGMFYGKNLIIKKNILGPKPKYVGKEKDILLIDPKAMEIVIKARGWNFGWVLSGKRYELPLLLKSFPIIGDYITPQTIITKHNLKLPCNTNNLYKTFNTLKSYKVKQKTNYNYKTDNYALEENFLIKSPNFGDFSELLLSQKVGDRMHSIQKFGDAKQPVQSITESVLSFTPDIKKTKNLNLLNKKYLNTFLKDLKTIKKTGLSKVLTNLKTKKINLKQNFNRKFFGLKEKQSKSKNKLWNLVKQYFIRKNLFSSSLDKNLKNIFLNTNHAPPPFGMGFCAGGIRPQYTRHDSAESAKQPHILGAYAPSAKVGRHNVMQSMTVGPNYALGCAATFGTKVALRSMIWHNSCIFSKQNIENTGGHALRTGVVCPQEGTQGTAQIVSKPFNTEKSLENLRPAFAPTTFAEQKLGEQTGVLSITSAMPQDATWYQNIKIKQDLLFLNLQKIKYHKHSYFHFFNSDDLIVNKSTYNISFFISQDKKANLNKNLVKTLQNYPTNNLKPKKPIFNYKISYNEMMVAPLGVSNPLYNSLASKLVKKHNIKNSTLLKRFKTSNNLLEWLSGILTSKPTNSLAVIPKTKNIKEKRKFSLISNKVQTSNALFIKTLRELISLKKKGTILPRSSGALAQSAKQKVNTSIYAVSELLQSKSSESEATWGHMPPVGKALLVVLKQNRQSHKILDYFKSFSTSNNKVTTFIKPTIYKKLFTYKKIYKKITSKNARSFTYWGHIPPGTKHAPISKRKIYYKHQRNLQNNLFTLFIRDNKESNNDHSVFIKQTQLRGINSQYATHNSFNIIKSNYINNLTKQIRHFKNNNNSTPIILKKQRKAAWNKNNFDFILTQFAVKQKSTYAWSKFLKSLDAAKHSAHNNSQGCNNQNSDASPGSLGPQYVKHNLSKFCGMLRILSKSCVPQLLSWSNQTDSLKFKPQFKFCKYANVLPLQAQHNGKNQILKHFKNISKIAPDYVSTTKVGGAAKHGFGHYIAASHNLSASSSQHKSVSTSKTFHNQLKDKKRKDFFLKKPLSLINNYFKLTTNNLYYLCNILPFCVQQLKDVFGQADSDTLTLTKKISLLYLGAYAPSILYTQQAEYTRGVPNGTIRSIKANLLKTSYNYFIEPNNMVLKKTKHGLVKHFVHNNNQNKNVTDGMQSMTVVPNGTTHSKNKSRTSILKQVVYILVNKDASQVVPHGTTHPSRLRTFAMPEFAKQTQYAEHQKFGENFCRAKVGGGTTHINKNTTDSVGFGLTKAGGHPKAKLFTSTTWGHTPPVCKALLDTVFKSKVTKIRETLQTEFLKNKLYWIKNKKPRFLPTNFGCNNQYHLGALNAPIALSMQSIKRNLDNPIVNSAVIPKTKQELKEKQYFLFSVFVNLILPENNYDKIAIHSIKNMQKLYNNLSLKDRQLIKKNSQALKLFNLSFIKETLTSRIRLLYSMTTFPRSHNIQEHTGGVGPQVKPNTDSTLSNTYCQNGSHKSCGSRFNTGNKFLKISMIRPFDGMASNQFLSTTQKVLSPKKYVQKYLFYIKIKKITQLNYASHGYGYYSCNTHNIEMTSSAGTLISKLPKQKKDLCLLPKIPNIALVINNLQRSCNSFALNSAQQRLEHTNNYFTKKVISYIKPPFFDLYNKQPSYFFTHTAKSFSNFIPKQPCINIGFYTKITSQLNPTSLRRKDFCPPTFGIGFCSNFWDKSSHAKHNSAKSAKQPGLFSELLLATFGTKVASKSSETKDFKQSIPNVVAYKRKTNQQMNTKYCNTQNHAKPGVIRPQYVKHNTFSCNKKRPLNNFSFIYDQTNVLTQRNYYSPFEGELIHIKPYKKYLVLNPYADPIASKKLLARNKTNKKKLTNNRRKHEEIRMILFDYYLSTVNQVSQSVKTKQQAWSRFNLVLTKNDLITLNTTPFTASCALDTATISKDGFLLDYASHTEGVCPQGGVLFKYNQYLQNTKISHSINKICESSIKNTLKIKTIIELNKETHFNKAYNFNLKNKWLETQRYYLEPNLHVPTEKKTLSFQALKNLMLCLGASAPSMRSIPQLLSQKLGGHNNSIKIKIELKSSILLKFLEQKTKHLIYMPSFSLVNKNWHSFNQKKFLTKNKVGFFFLKGNPFLKALSTKITISKSLSSLTSSKLYTNFYRDAKHTEFASQTLAKVFDIFNSLVQDSRYRNFKYCAEIQRLHLNQNFLKVNPWLDKPGGVCPQAQNLKIKEIISGIRPVYAKKIIRLPIITFSAYALQSNAGSTNFKKYDSMSSFDLLNCQNSINSSAELPSIFMEIKYQKLFDILKPIDFGHKTSASFLNKLFFTYIHLQQEFLTSKLLNSVYGRDTSLIKNKKLFLTPTTFVLRTFAEQKFGEHSIPKVVGHIADPASFKNTLKINKPLTTKLNSAEQSYSFNKNVLAWLGISKNVSLYYLTQYIDLNLVTVFKNVKELQNNLVLSVFQNQATQSQIDYAKPTKSCLIPKTHGYGYNSIGSLQRKVVWKTGQIFGEIFYLGLEDTLKSRFGGTSTNLLVIKRSGQLMHMNKEKITIRIGQPLVISPNSIIHASHGDFISSRTPVINLTYQQLQTGDIVQGIPKIEQLFEARTTKRGRLFRDNITNLLTGLFLKYFIKTTYLFRKNMLSFFKKNFYKNYNKTALETIILSLALEWSVKQSFYKIQEIIVDGILRVYRSQGVGIADKHVEIIVKQMTSKVRIINSNKIKLTDYSFTLNTINAYFPKKTKTNKIFENTLLEQLLSNNLKSPTGLFPGEIVDLDFVENINTRLCYQSSAYYASWGHTAENQDNIEPLKYEPIVLGITRASLEVESFLSAASFQQTTRVLSQAALYKKKDFLKGLKENIIIGNLIPAGTGYISNLSF